MLKDYLYRLFDTITSRGSIDVEILSFDDQSSQRGSIQGRLRFYDDSLLVFDETIILRNNVLEKLRYAYHYQNSSGELVFRYDNAPHYPNISTFPHHKHVGAGIHPAQVPDLSNILH